jgi:hypothetical protein
LRVYSANLTGQKIQDGQIIGYATEYMALPALNELFVFGRLPAASWDPIFKAIVEFIETAHAVDDGRRNAALTHDDSAQYEALYRGKTLERLHEFAQGQAENLDIKRPIFLNGHALPSLLDMANECADAVLGQSPLQSALVHGDLCFSNILYDFRTSRVKLIDPRGLSNAGEVTSSGDMRYDIGKFAHSVLGGYDFIVAGRCDVKLESLNEFSFEFIGNTRSDVQARFRKLQILGKSSQDWGCYPIMILLFLSMLPLHADSPQRQLAFMANAGRLYQEWKK